MNKERVLAVREILKRPEHVEGIDGILMADSLYCGYAGENHLQHVRNIGAWLPMLLWGDQRDREIPGNGQGRDRAVGS